MCVQRKIEAHSLTHCCRRKAISITYSECMFVALSIEHALCVRHIVICGLSSCAVYFHIISSTAFFFKVIEHNVCLDFV